MPSAIDKRKKKFNPSGINAFTPTSPEQTTVETVKTISAWGWTRGMKVKFPSFFFFFGRFPENTKRICTNTKNRNIGGAVEGDRREIDKNKRGGGPEKGGVLGVLETKTELKRPVALLYPKRSLASLLFFVF